MHEEKVDMEDVEEVAETNEEVGQVEGTDEGLLRLENVGLQGGNSDMAARDTFSSSGIANSVRGSGTVRVSMGEGVGKIEIPITTLAPLSGIGLNRILLLPRASPSNLVENSDNWAANSISWVADSVNETSASPSILKERNEEGAVNDEDDIAVQSLNTHTEVETILAPLKAAINGVQGKKKRKSIYDILGFSKVNSSNKGRKSKQKCGTFRSTIAVAALSASISSSGVVNRNRIILNEAQAIWECNKIMGLGYDGDEDEVISRFVEMEAQDLDRADRAAGQL